MLDGTAILSGRNVTQEPNNIRTSDHSRRHIDHLDHSFEKQGSDWKISGTLKPMIAKDGPHYVMA